MNKFSLWLGIILNGFFVIFFVLYIARFGLTDLVLNPDDTWKVIFNIGIWYVLIMHVINELGCYYFKMKKQKEVK